METYIFINTFGRKLTEGDVTDEITNIVTNNSEMLRKLLQICLKKENILARSKVFVGKYLATSQYACSVKLNVQIRLSGFLVICRVQKVVEITL